MKITYEVIIIWNSIISIYLIIYSVYFILNNTHKYIFNYTHNLFWLNQKILQHKNKSDYFYCTFMCTIRVFNVTLSITERIFFIRFSRNSGWRSYALLTIANLIRHSSPSRLCGYTRSASMTRSHVSLWFVVSLANACAQRFGINARIRETVSRDALCLCLRFSFCFGSLVKLL